MRQALHVQDGGQGDRGPGGHAAITFMAKYDDRGGQFLPHPHARCGTTRTNPCSPVPGTTGSRRYSSNSWPACSPHCRELTLFVAPNVNSYKRFVTGSFAPTALAWGHDNRSCALRVVGHHPSSLRVECRVPGGGREPLPGVVGDCRRWSVRYREGPRARARVRRQCLCLGQAAVAAPTSGRQPDCSPRARSPVTPSATTLSPTTPTWHGVELDAFDATVTDWERYRGFERL